MVTVGIDEVGRGCLAGPLVAGAVILGVEIHGIRDSKQLSRSNRERLALEINCRAAAIGLGWVSPKEIDTLGLTSAVRLAMQRSLSLIRSKYQLIIIDGSFNYLAELKESKAIIKADQKIAEVGAASIIAKVARDAYMKQVS